MRVDIVSIFPEYLAPLDLSLIGKARRSGLLELAVRDLREFTHDRHRTVDDAPAGGGAGMVMKPEPWAEALDAVLTDAVPTDAGRASAPEAAHSSSVLAGPMRTLPVGSPPERESALPAEPAPTSPLLLVPSPSGRPFTQPWPGNWPPSRG